MGKPVVIGQDELLALDIDVIDVIAVDDEPPADTDEQVALGAQLITDHTLDLPQLEGEQARLIVGLHQVAVIAVRRDEDDFLGGNTHQVGSCGYDEILFEHDAAKIELKRKRKAAKRGKMYETGGLLYEMTRQEICQ